MPYYDNRNPGGSSLYPLHPIGSQYLIRFSENECTIIDKVVTAITNLIIIGSYVWFPTLYIILWKKCQNIQNVKKRKVCKSILISSLLLYIWGPHRNTKFGKFINIRKWNIWLSSLRYVAIEIITDYTTNSNNNNNNNIMTKEKMDKNRQEIITFTPHGIYPYIVAYTGLPHITSEQIFGICRIASASATDYLPMINDLGRFINKVDVSRVSLSNALLNGDRISIVPGGIADIFQGYPKVGTKPNEEYSIIRKGLFRLAYKYNVPVIPIYCFGSSKTFNRMHIPWLEKLSKITRTSFVLFYGKFGLYIPFRQKMSYVIGNAIIPPPTISGNNSQEQAVIDEMFEKYCNELYRIFNRHKDAYGWGDKTLKLIKR